MKVIDRSYSGAVVLFVLMCCLVWLCSCSSVVSDVYPDGSARVTSVDPRVKSDVVLYSNGTIERGTLLYKTDSPRVEMFDLVHGYDLDSGYRYVQVINRRETHSLQELFADEK